MVEILNVIPSNLSKEPVPPNEQLTSLINYFTTWDTSRCNISISEPPSFPRRVNVDQKPNS